MDGENDGDDGIACNGRSAVCSAGAVQSEIQYFLVSKSKVLFNPVELKIRKTLL
jgi:hypothetical protein